MAGSKGGGCLPMVAVLIAVGFIANTCSGGSDSSGDDYGAKGACEGWVKDRLKSPSTADFSNESVNGGSGSWTITGDVDSENGFGAMLRSSWSCDVRLDGNYYRGNASVFG